MNINEVLEEITNTCREHMQTGEWTKNDAMRYAYIEMGKRISKSAKFFFSVEGKYGEYGLSVEDMESIHFADAGFEVTCYVTAKMLKKIFGDLGIKSEIIQSATSRPYTRNDKTLEIYHSYLIAEGDDDKKYFLSPNMDLLNIKHNFPLEHFANAVPYVYNGVQTYQGEEIDYSTLTPAELLEIDKKIGYAFPLKNIYDGKTYYVYANKDRVHDAFGRQQVDAEQYLLDQIHTLDRGFQDGYFDLIQSFCKDGEKKTNFSDLTRDEINKLEWYVFSRCLELAKENLNIAKDNMEDLFLDKFNGNKLDIKDLQDQTKKYIVTHLNKDNRAIIDELQKNPFRIMSSAMNLITFMENITSSEYTNSLSDVQKSNSMRYYHELIQNISKVFLTQDVLDKYMGDKNPSNLFVTKKIINSIQKDFECEMSKSSNYRPEFFRMGAVEQSAFLKQYLRSIMKPEFATDQEFLDRIMFSALSEKQNKDSYAYLIHIKSKEEKTDEFMYTLVYNPSTNQINSANFLDLKLRYNILSKTVMSHLASTMER